MIVSCNVERSVALSVPAAPDYARVARMAAATLAAAADFGVDDVEDVRMAAEEGFVYACATGQKSVDMTFSREGEGLSMYFSLGEDLDALDDESLDLVEALLDAICADFGIDEEGDALVLELRAGGVHGEQ